MGASASLPNPHLAARNRQARKVPRLAYKTYAGNALLAGRKIQSVLALHSVTVDRQQVGTGNSWNDGSGAAQWAAWSRLCSQEASIHRGVDLWREEQEGLPLNGQGGAFTSILYPSEWFSLDGFFVFTASLSVLKRVGRTQWLKLPAIRGSEVYRIKLSINTSSPLH